MKLIWLFFVLSSINSPISAKEISLLYKVTSGKSESPETITIQKNPDGFTILSGSTHHNVSFDFSQDSWEYEEDSVKTKLTAYRQGNIIFLKGMFKGKVVEKQYTIDDSPWSQCAHIFLEKFVSSEKQETAYWYISTDDLKKYEIRVKRKGQEDILVNNRKTSAVHIRIRPAGFAGNFWSGDYWYRADDSRYVKYRAVHGPPGTPFTIKELVRE